MEKVDKPCEQCGVMLHNIYSGQRYCEKCRKERFLKKEEKPKSERMTLRDIMREADKEGLQYASYCKKHGLY